MSKHWYSPGLRRVFGVPGGSEALVLADAARAGQPVLFVARDDVHMDLAAEALAFMAPDLKVLTFPAWDCLPYDRVSPKTDIVPRRVGTLDVPKSFCKGFCPGYCVGRILWSVRICRGSRSVPPERAKLRRGPNGILQVPHSANSPKEVCCAVAVAQLAECATQVETLIYYPRL